jgi:L,D-peptidoglycan transpeptidase YkuD (ErfK/YbiS/YcfS/YnhG family)
MQAPVEYRIVIAKQARRLDLLRGLQVECTYAVTLGRNSGTDKAIEGDEATPLGDFYVCAKNPRSKHFLSLCISYPNAEDAGRGLAGGLIDADEHAKILQAVAAGKMPPQHTRLGGEIYIHGRGERFDPNGTRGCIALNNPDMQALYDRVAIGTAVRIID